MSLVYFIADLFFSFLLWEKEDRLVAFNLAIFYFDKRQLSHLAVRMFTLFITDQSVRGLVIVHRSKRWMDGCNSMSKIRVFNRGLY